MQVELCRFLYKLHFQQLLLLESYTKLLQLLSGAAGTSGVADLSSRVAGARAALLTALADTLTPPSSPAVPACPGSPARASTPSPACGDSPTPRASPPLPVLGGDGDAGQQIPEIAVSPPPRPPSQEEGESTEHEEAVEEIEDKEEEKECKEDLEDKEDAEEGGEVFLAEMTGEVGGPAPLPATKAEALSLLLSHLTAQRWKEVRTRPLHCTTVLCCPGVEGVAGLPLPVGLRLHARLHGGQPVLVPGPPGDPLTTTNTSWTIYCRIRRI